MLDILYYSNYCSFCQKLIQYLVKNGMQNKLNYICIDNRKLDKRTNELCIYLENGKKLIMPPNIHSVPSVILPKDKYRLLCGEDDILLYFKPLIDKKKERATTDGPVYSVSSRYESATGEPMGVSMVSSVNRLNVLSEQFTLYDLSPDDLSAKGSSEKRDLYNYYPATHDISYHKIPTPPDTYRPDKLATNVTVDSLEQKRFSDIQSESSSLI